MKARAAANCDRRARCVKSPEMATRSGFNSYHGATQRIDQAGIDAPEMQIRKMNQRLHGSAQHLQRVRLDGKPQRRFELARPRRRCRANTRRRLERDRDLSPAAWSRTARNVRACPSSARNGIDIDAEPARPRRHVQRQLVGRQILALPQRETGQHVAAVADHDERDCAASDRGRRW